MASAETLQLKFCSLCGKALPIDQFGLRNKNGHRRHSDCRACHARYGRERKQAESRREVTQFVKKVVKAQRDVNRVIGLTRHLFARFRNLGRIADIFYAGYEEARDAGRHYTAFRYLQCLFDLAAISDLLSGEKVRHMTDEELRQRLYELSQQS